METKIYLIIASYKFADGTTYESQLYADKTFDAAINDVAKLNNEEEKNNVMKSTYFFKEISLY